MSEFVSWLASQLWGFFLGILSSLAVYIILTVLPIKENVRYKVIFYRRKLRHLFFDTPIKIFYTIKTQNLSEKNYELNDFVNTIKKRISQNSFTIKGERGTANVFNYLLGTTEVEITLTPSYEINGDNREEVVVEYLQCDFRLIESKYRNFNGHLMDLLQIFRKLETSLEDYVGKWIGESLTCEIHRLYDFVGVLKDLNMSSLKGKIGGQYDIELFKDKLVVYGLFETRMTKMIKDIITYYY